MQGDFDEVMTSKLWSKIFVSRTINRGFSLLALSLAKSASLVESAFPESVFVASPVATNDRSCAALCMVIGRSEEKEVVPRKMSERK